MAAQEEHDLPLRVERGREGGGPSDQLQHADADANAAANTAANAAAVPPPRLLPLRLFYFFYFASLAAFVPFVSLYLRDAAPARLSASQVGAVAALRPLVSAPAGVLLSALADKRSWHAPLLVGGHALSALSRAALVPASRTLAGVVAVTIATEAVGAPVCIIADAAAVAAAGGLGYGSLRLWGAVGWGGMSMASGTVLHLGGMRASAAVYLALAVPALWAAARMPCDGIAKEEKKKEAKAAAAVVEGGGGGGGEEEGQQEMRTKKSKAFEMAAARCCDDDGDDSGERDNRSGALLLAAADERQQQRQQQQQQPPPTSVVALLRRDPGVALFLATACLFGVGVGAIGEFLFLHLKDSLGAPEWLMDATLAVTCAAEVPAFRLQPRLLRAVGVRAALRLVALAYVARTALYAALPALARRLVPLGGGGGGGSGSGVGAGAPAPPPLFPPYLLVLPVEVLHGLCFAVAWGAGTCYCRRAAPPGCEAELQGWFSGCFFGLGQGAGCLIAGALYSRLGGGEGMFAAVSGGLAVGFLVLEALGMVWPWAVLRGGAAALPAGEAGAGGGEEQEEEEGAWLLEQLERWRRSWLGAAVAAVARALSSGGGGGGGGGWAAAVAASSSPFGGGRRHQHQHQQHQHQQPRQQHEQRRYLKLEHKNSDAELALVGVGAGGGGGGGGGGA